MTLPGLSSTGLLLVILSWNEAFWSLNLTSVNAAPLPVFIASYSSPEGLILGEVVSGFLSGGGPDHGAGLDDPETTGARIDLWSGQIEKQSL